MHAEVWGYGGQDHVIPGTSRTAVYQGFQGNGFHLSTNHVVMILLLKKMCVFVSSNWGPLILSF